MTPRSTNKSSSQPAKQLTDKPFRSSLRRRPAANLSLFRACLQGLVCSAGSYFSHVYALEFKVQRAVNAYQSHGSGTIVEYLARGRLIFDGYQHAFTAGVTAARRVISLGG